MEDKKQKFVNEISKMMNDFYRDCIERFVVQAIDEYGSNNNEKEQIYSIYRKLIDGKKKELSNKELSEFDNFLLNNDTITFTNEHGTLLNIGNGASLFIGPRHITYSDEKSGALYKVDGPAIATLYNSEEFSQGIVEYTQEGKVDKLMQTIMIFALAKDAIKSTYEDNIDKYNKSGYDIKGEQACIKAMARACDKEYFTQKYLSEQYNELKKYKLPDEQIKTEKDKIKNEMAKNRLEHATQTVGAMLQNAVR